jgi:hypothetical protein
VGQTTRFDESDLFMGGNVNAAQFFGDASHLTRTCDVQPGIYGNGSLIPQIWVNESGRISSIQLSPIFVTLGQATQFNSSTGSTIQLKNTSVGLQSEGDIQLRNGKDVAWFDNFGNSVCTLGQKSECDSRVAHFVGTQTESSLNISNWKKVSINSGLSVDSRGFTSLKGCFMESGTGCVLNAQQVSKSPETLLLGPSDLFKWFTCMSPSEKKVLVPDPRLCTAGSWIGITNISRYEIKVLDASGRILHTIIKPSEFVGGTSCRLLCVSSLASASGTGVMGDVWIVA